MFHTIGALLSCFSQSMRTMLKLIVFDCDGVMFDSRLANREFYNTMLKEFGHPPMDENELEYVHIHNVQNAIAHVFRNYPETSFAEVDAFRKAIGYKPFLPFMKMETDLINFLDRVQSRYHLAISTNRSDTMEPLLQTFGLQGYFQKVMTSLNARRPKPAPDALVEILEYFGCCADEAIFIGDSILDRQHSASCGVPLIGFKNKNLPADYHVNSFMEILTLPPFQDHNPA